MNRIEYNFHNLKQIAAGGEGRILEHPNKDYVIKYYHDPKPLSFIKHLESLSKLNDDFLKPINCYTLGGKVVGFDMKYVNLNDYYLFNNLFNKNFCTTNNVTYNFKLFIIAKLKTSIEYLHSHNIVVGDLNQYNLFFSLKGDILFVDVDSYQTSHQKHSGVLLDEVRDWTTTLISNLSDYWAYDILCFWILTYVHPFKWVLKGNNETLDMRVRANKSYLNMSGIIIPKLYEPLEVNTQEQFRSVFEGKRFLIEPNKKLITLNTISDTVASQSLVFRLVANDVTRVIANSNFLTYKVKDIWRLLVTNVSKFYNEVGVYDCDYLYPSVEGKVTVLRNNVLKGIHKSYFVEKNLIHYYNGCLTVIDPHEDRMRNYNLNNQLLEIDHTSNDIFSKSVLLRDCLIQNFGNKKYILVSIGNKSQLIDIDFGAKNAIIHGDYYCVEYVKNNSTLYKIVHWKTKKELPINHYSYFSSAGNILFIPEDGFIAVYRDMVFLSKLDINICTKNSQVFHTISGIFLLENNKLYLLNTK